MMQIYETSKILFCYFWPSLCILWGCECKSVLPYQSKYLCYCIKANICINVSKQIFVSLYQSKYLYQCIKANIFIILSRQILVLLYKSKYLYHCIKANICILVSKQIFVSLKQRQRNMKIANVPNSRTVKWHL